jgi:hypothetical protein
MFLFIYGYTFHLIIIDPSGNCYASKSYIPLVKNPIEINNWDFEF